MRQQLRDYQERGLAQILDAYKQGARRVLMTLPTGGGKTSVFAHLVADLAGKGLPSVILVHRRELAAQAATRLQEFGVDFGFILAGESVKPYAPVQIASVQTLVRRKVPPACLVVCDEAHLSTATTWKNILDQYPTARILGCTATPWRLSGKPLAGLYDAAVVVSTPRELREQGYLCGYVGFGYKAPDLSGIKTTGGDYNEKQSAEAMSKSAIVDSIVEEWLLNASELSTVVFAVTVEHSKQLTEKFRAAGVVAEHLDGSTALETRRAILARVESGETRVLCNVGVAVEGLDIPRLKCCVLARPTKSLARAIQMMGRVRRPWNGVTARIHDHAFVIRGPNGKGHGAPDDERDYQLTAGTEKPAGELGSLTQCPKCFAYIEGTRCAECGADRPVTERKLNLLKDAEKVEFASGDAPAPAPEVTRPPVDVKWTDIGRKVEGIFTRTWVETTQYGEQKTYLVKGAKREYRFRGTVLLDRLMAKVQISDSICLEYLGEEALEGGKYRKKFKLEVDDGAAAA